MVYTRFNSYVFVLRTNLEPNGEEDRVVSKKKYRATLFRRIDGTSFLFAIIFLPFVVKIPRGKFVKILFRMREITFLIAKLSAIEKRSLPPRANAYDTKAEIGRIFRSIGGDRAGGEEGYTCPLRDVEGGDGGVRRETKQRRVGMDEIVGTF